LFGETSKKKANGFTKKKGTVSSGQRKNGGSKLSFNIGKKRVKNSAVIR